MSNNGWFKVWTNPNDPTNIEYTRMTDEEAQQAYAEQLIQEIRYYHPEWFENAFQPLINSLVEATEVLDKFGEALNPPIDKKQQARERSKADLKNKRKLLMSGKL